ncbi:Poly(A) polymerase central domain-containing protein [Thamnidium elegans]|nr:Poly(A) polymerase central domain-containing protein [Thamnidium elegans]
MINITDEQWISYLQDNSIVENTEDYIKKQQVLSLLNSTILNFQRKIISYHDYKRGEIQCILSPFGSYSLGGYICGADIDLVLLCPWIVKRNDFFKFLPELLKTQPTVRDVESIKKTSVPIIKCTIDSISIDISFVRLKGNRLPENLDLLDDSLLNGLDQACISSMDGPRVDKFIKSQIKPAHIQIFKRSLQCIKYWAKERDIYNKPMGYLNGSSWTLLLLKTYMNENRKHENLSISHLLYAFFKTWIDWPWPTPVMFTNSIPGGNGTSISYSELTLFNNAVMPIVTPCYPVSNATNYVTKSTLKIMIKEFQRALVILSTNTRPGVIMKKLFNTINYFKRYSDFICVTTTSTTSTSHEIWTRRMQFTIPQLLSLIETCHAVKQIQAMVNPTIVIRHYRSEQERAALQNGVPPEVAKDMGLMGGLNPGTINIIYHFIGIQLNESHTFVDLSEDIKTFYAILENKRNRHDDDLKWSVSAMKKIDVAKMMSIDTN